jgi:hypothetical protein
MDQRRPGRAQAQVGRLAGEETREAAAIRPRRGLLRGCPEVSRISAGLHDVELHRARVRLDDRLEATLGAVRIRGGRIGDRILEGGKHGGEQMFQPCLDDR